VRKISGSLVDLGPQSVREDRSRRYAARVNFSL